MSRKKDIETRAVPVTTSVPANLLKASDEAGICRADALKRGMTIILQERKANAEGAQ